MYVCDRASAKGRMVSPAPASSVDNACIIENQTNGYQFQLLCKILKRHI